MNFTFDASEHNIWHFRNVQIISVFAANLLLNHYHHFMDLHSSCFVWQKFYSEINFSIRTGIQISLWIQYGSLSSQSDKPINNYINCNQLIMFFFELFCAGAYPNTKRLRKCIDIHSNLMTLSASRLKPDDVLEVNKPYGNQIIFRSSNELLLLEYRHHKI